MRPLDWPVSDRQAASGSSTQFQVPVQLLGLANRIKAQLFLLTPQLSSMLFAAGYAVVVKRGNCSFVDKALHLQQANAAMMLVYDDEPGAGLQCLFALIAWRELVVVAWPHCRCRLTPCTVLPAFEGSQDDMRIPAFP